VKIGNPRKIHKVADARVLINPGLLMNFHDHWTANFALFAVNCKLCAWLNALFLSVFSPKLWFSIPEIK
jgi:hypothetical protein